MHIQAIPTPVFQKNQNLVEFILQHSQGLLKENTLLAVTSKIVSLSEGRTLAKNRIHKTRLIQKEADHYLGKIQYGTHLTIKHGVLVPSAGVDESNSPTGEYILYPQNPLQSAKQIWQSLRQKLGLKNLGLLITDSHTLPLKPGVVGMALASAGFEPVRSLTGHPDLFHRPLKMTRINVAQALAASAVLLMGEGADQKPLALLSQAPVTFTSESHSPPPLPLNEDLYFPLYKPLLKKDQ